MSYLQKTLSKGLGALASSLGAPPPPPEEEADEEGDTFVDAPAAALHPDAHEDGGVACRDAALLDRQRAAIREVVRSLGKSLLAGNFDLLRLSLPVRLFEPRSYLQKLADPWVYPQLLAAAAAQRDAAARLRLVATYILAGFHRAFGGWAKPFNPILGETWQAALPDGSRLAAEQVSHHPPVAAYELRGPGGAYVFRGVSQPGVSYSANSIRTTARGHRCVEFADGGRVDIVYPAYSIRGLLATSAPRGEVVGAAEFADAAAGLRLVVRLGRVEGAPPGSLLARPDALEGALVRARPAAPASEPAPERRRAPAAAAAAAAAALRGRSFTASLSRSVARLGAAAGGGGGDAGADAGLSPRDPGEPPPAVVSRVTGNWLSHVDWDGERAWTLGEDAAAEWEPDPAPLPSDCRHREDLVALAAALQQARGAEGWALAQRAKDALEQRQRADAKLRKEGQAAAGLR